MTLSIQNEQDLNNTQTLLYKLCGGSFDDLRALDDAFCESAFPYVAGETSNHFFWDEHDYRLGLIYVCDPSDYWTE